MILEDRNALSLLSGARCVKWNEDRSTLSAAEDSPGSQDFNNLQDVHKFAGNTPRMGIKCVKSAILWPLR